MTQKDKVSRDVTIFDVANEASVSYSTVSRVINNKEHVSQEKRERVLKTMAELGYVANIQARTLAGGRSNIVGLLVHGLNTSYIGEIIKGIDTELGSAHYDLMLYTTHRRKLKESEYVTRLTRNLVDGLLLVLPRNEEVYLAALRQRQFPHVLVDYQGMNQDVPTVVATNRRGAYEATSYLIAIGHRRIGFITGNMEQGCAQERLAGYKAALEDHGLPVLPQLIQEGNFLQPRGYSCAKALLSLAEPPTAIFASNDISAFGVMEAVRDHGLQIPRDISIIGFDDIPQTAHVHPPLTTVCQPLEEMGSIAARMLVKYIMEPDSPIERREVPTTLVIRQSCAPLSSSS
ncbi:MAG TPA: LacI family DNA-binding transcriptional regulator [Ktedonobacteraceae bacterium]|jgi:LacI family transcriptional regulator|nr:LacI family DNA-binding transcriptional regulator [Ktedonobacteraceae bacterium]